jgi:putative membrane protein
LDDMLRGGRFVGTTALAAAALALTAAPSSAYRAPSRVSGQDQTYLQSALEGDAFEVTAGRLALRKSENADVRLAATRYAHDHAASGSDAKRLAKRLRVQGDFAPSPSQQWEIQMLSELDGAAFDHKYAYLEVLDHKQDLFEAKQEVENGSNRQVVASAREEIPMLRKHLTLARRALKASPNGGA